MIANASRASMACRSNIQRGLALTLGLALLAGCKKDAAAPANELFPPTSAALLSSGSPTKDEDPSVLRARDGTMFLAWFSDRGNNPDIYITNTASGSNWSTPVRVTTNAGGDFNPSLMQDAQGTFHLTWFRWTAPFRGNIWYNSSPDGKTWNPGAEVQATNVNAVDDWVPTLVELPDGSLAIYFVSDLRDAVNRTNEIYVTFKRSGSTTWTAAVPVPGINSSTEHDHLPFAARAGNGIALVWVRHDTTQALPWVNPKSAVYFSTSTDGSNFAAPIRVTNDAGNVVNLFPGLFAQASGALSLVWLSTRSGPPRVYELPGIPLAFSGAPVENTALPGAGYSHRIAATPTPGVYLGVWVQGPDGSQDIYYRFYK